MRKDYYRDLWTFVAPGRALRPFDPEGIELGDSTGCFFCPGNEHTTPPEISRVARNGSWQVRIFPNKFPITGAEEGASENGWKVAPSHGYHEVIVETPDHHQRVSQITAYEMVLTLEAYRDRINYFESDPAIGYVSVFKNQGREAGASLDHSHTQILAVSQVPARIREKMEHSHSGDCAYCSIVEKETSSPRLVFESENFIALCPFAPQFTHELWVIPKAHVGSLNGISSARMNDLAAILLRSLNAVEKVAPNYNMMVNYGPKGADFHFHIEIVPRVPHQVKAGFELSTNYSVITTPPEETAAFYRG